jgi:hypothetical protein
MKLGVSQMFGDQRVTASTNASDDFLLIVGSHTT